MSRRIEKRWNLKHVAVVQTKGYQDEMGEDLSDLVDDHDDGDLVLESEEI